MLDLVCRQVQPVGGEVVLVGPPAACPPVPVPGVRVVVVERGDVFTARSAAVAAVRGEVVAIIEDHCFPPPGWAAALLAAYAARPDADALVTAIDNGAPKLLDRASFLVTWAPFIGPMAEVPGDRCPAPGVLSFRRRALPAASPPLGWLEYELPVALRAAGQMAVDDSIRMLHTQYVGLRAFVLQYAAGRVFTGIGNHRAAAAGRRVRLRAAFGTAAKLARQTRAAVAANDAWRGDRLALAGAVALACCNAAGQVVGVLTGSPGRCLAVLE